MFFPGRKKIYYPLARLVNHLARRFTLDPSKGRLRSPPAPPSCRTVDCARHLKIALATIRTYPALLHHTRTNIIHCSILDQDSDPGRAERLLRSNTPKELSFDAVCFFLAQYQRVK